MIWAFISIFTLLVVLFYLFPIIQVCGDSMCPTFNDGDIIIGCRIFKLKLGDVYIFNPPVGQENEKRYFVIKRVLHIIVEQPKKHRHKNRYGFYGDVKVFFVGDNSAVSFDSRNYGTVEANKILAKYLFTIHRKRKK